MRTPYTCCIIVLLPLMLCLVVYLTRSPVPRSSPHQYPVNARHPIYTQDKAWNELRACGDAIGPDAVESSAAMKWKPGAGPPDPRAPEVVESLVAAQPAFRHLRASRREPDFQPSRYEFLTPEFCAVVRLAYFPAVEGLRKGDIEPALDYVAACSRYGMQTWRGFQDEEALNTNMPLLASVVELAGALPKDRRREFLRNLNTWVDQQRAFDEQLLVLREWQVDSFLNPSTFKLQFRARLQPQLGELTLILRAKWDRWLFFVRDGDFHSLKGDADRYWRSDLPSNSLENALWTCRYLMAPAETVSTMASYSRSYPAVVDPLTDLTVKYNDTRLRWEAWRLSMALDLYLEEKGVAAKRLEDLVAAGLLIEVPSDPYHLKEAESRGLPQAPLGYDGEKIWSVGWDGIDQKGARRVYKLSAPLPDGDLIVWEAATGTADPR